MPAKRTHNLPFSEYHNEIMEHIHKLTRDPYAEINRRIWDDFLERYPNTAWEYQRKKVQEIENTLEIEKSRLTTIELSEDNAPFLAKNPISVHLGEAVSKPLEPLSGHDEFVHFIGRLGSAGKWGVSAKRKVLAHLRDHPEWSAEIPEETRKFLEVTE